MFTVYLIECWYGVCRLLVLARFGFWLWLWGCCRLLVLAGACGWSVVGFGTFWLGVLELFVVLSVVGFGRGCGWLVHGVVALWLAFLFGVRNVFGVSGGFNFFLNAADFGFLDF
jgi:hypothetical protein